MTRTKKQIEDAFKQFEIADWQYEECEQLLPCKACGSRAAVFENTHFAAFCTNIECENSILGQRKIDVCWRTNEQKAAHDWNNEQIK